MLHPRWLLTRTAPIVVLLALASVCFARLVAHPTALVVDGQRPSIDHANPGEPRGAGNDATFFLLPHHLAIARVVRTFGHLPRWDDRGFGGRPLAGNPQAGMFYPPVWLVWWSGAPSLLGWLTVGHLLWGGIGAYVLMRSFAVGRWAATVAAAIYQASPFLLAHTFEGHYPHVWAACWYPWAFWAYSQHRTGRHRGRLLLPMILAFTFLTGHPQEWFLLVLALTTWSLFDAGKTWRERGPRRAACKLIGSMALLGLSIGIAAVEVVPEVAVRPWLVHNPGASGGADIPRRYHLWQHNAWQLLSPIALGGPSDYFGDDNYWETVFSIGLAPLVLATLGAIKSPNRRLVRGWLVLAGFAIWLACGRHLLLYEVAFRIVPGMSWFRVPARSLFLANLAAAVLAGLGVETLAKELDRRHRDWRKTGDPICRGLPAAFGQSVLHSADSWSRRVVTHGRGGESSAQQWLLLADPGRPDGDHAYGGLCERTAGPSSCREMAGPARPGRTRLVRLFAPAGGRPPSSSSATIRSGPRSSVSIGVTVDPDRIRIKARDSFYGDLPAATLGIEKTNITDVFQLGHAARLYETLYPVASFQRRWRDDPMQTAVDDYRRDLRQAVFDRLSVGYLVSNRFEADPGWPVVARGATGRLSWVIQRNPSALPRAYVVPTATVSGERARLTLPRFREVDPHETVFMHTDPLRLFPDQARQPFTPAELVSVDPDHPALTVTTEAPGLLVITDTWMPGWTAHVDGEPMPILEGNLAQRVIPLPRPGRHTIALDYHTPGLSLGCALTVLSIITWAFMGFLLRPPKAHPARTLSAEKNARSLLILVRNKLSRTHAAP